MANCVIAPNQEANYQNVNLDLITKCFVNSH